MSRNSCQQRIKKIAIFRTKFKDRCTFATSEFPTEIPRTQKRNSFYTKPVVQSFPAAS
jgi:hypothetical protein